MALRRHHRIALEPARTHARASRPIQGFTSLRRRPRFEPRLAAKKERFLRMHWWPKIQVSGTGLALVSGFAPTLGIEIPYAFRAIGCAVGVFMIASPFLDLLRCATRMWLILGMIAGAILFAGCAIAFYLGPTPPISTVTNTDQVQPAGPTLTPAQEQLLSLIAKYQGRFVVSKLIVGRDGKLYFDGQPEKRERT